MASAVSIAPSQRLGAGGEAEVFEVAGQRSLAYKRYRTPSPERTAKLAVMVANPPEGLADGGHVAIAWPQEVVERDGLAIGFTMPRIDTASTVPLFQVYNPQSRRAVAPGFSWRYLLRTARNVAAIVDAVHRAGHVIGDLNESNFLVSKRALVTLVDCDSLQVVDPDSGFVHRCPVGKPEFLAPELQQADLAATSRTFESDRFALAVLVHLILLEGAHPFAGVWRGRGDPPDIGTRITKRAAAHHRRGPVDPPPLALDLRVLPHEVRRLLTRALGPGLRRPGRRPTAQEWVTALDAVEARLQACEHSPHHQHGSHLRACPWCARLRLGLPDPFPGPTGAGVAPPPPLLSERVRQGVARAVRRCSAACRRTLSGVARTSGRWAGRRVAEGWRLANGWLGDWLSSSLPRRLAAAGLGALAPLIAVSLAVILGAGMAVEHRDAGGRPLRRAARWVTRSARRTPAEVVAAGAAAASVGVGVTLVVGWSAPAGLRSAAACLAAILALPLPPLRRDGRRRGDADARRRRRGPAWFDSWAARWTVVAVIGGLGWFAGRHASVAWPLDLLVELVVA